MLTTTELALTSFILILFWLWRRRRPRNFPPGPPSVPLLGSLPFLGVHPNRTLMEWRETYGPVVGLDFVGWRTIALSSHKLIKQCLNDANFSSRPALPFMSDRSNGQAQGIIFTTGRQWEEQKRFTLRTLRDFGFGKKSMERIINDEIHELIQRLSSNSGTPVSITNKFNVAIVNALWTVVAGERFSQDDEKLLRVVSLITRDLSSFNMRTMLSTFIPWFARYAPDWVSGYSAVLGPVGEVRRFLTPYIQQHLESHVRRQPRDFIDAYIDEMENVKECGDTGSSFLHPDSLIYSIYDLFMAGAETTSATLTWVIYYLIRYQNVQEKVFEEILNVVGSSRLPTLSDRVNLPYTESVINEVMRVRILVPMTMQSTVKDVKLNGYDIPKQTMVLFNLYSCHNDVEIWGDPETFRPERWIADGVFRRREGFVSFSGGRRVCLGERLARDELFLFTAGLVQAFRFEADPEVGEVSLEARSLGVLMPVVQRVVLVGRELESNKEM